MVHIVPFSPALQLVQLVQFLCFSCSSTAPFVKFNLNLLNSTSSALQLALFPALQPV
jgi:hypothetical protein